jgi:hypothetical protein
MSYLITLVGGIKFMVNLVECYDEFVRFLKRNYYKLPSKHKRMENNLQ